MTKDVFERDYTQGENNPILEGWYEIPSMTARLLVPALNKLIEDSSGYPIELRELKEGLDNTTTAHDKWKAILIKIRDGFQAYLDEDSSMTVWTKETAEANEAKIREGLDLFAQYFTRLWD